MTGIDKTNLHAMATDIAKQLDRKDGEDNKIGASIWNEFVKDKGGKQIKYSITLENAIKSITTYIARTAAKTGEAFGDIADKWFNADVTPVKQTLPIDETEPTKKSTATNHMDNTYASDLPPQKLKLPVQEVKPLYTRMAEALDLLYCGQGRDVMNQRKTGQAEGKRLANLIKNPSENLINDSTKANAAYAFLEILNQIPSLGKTWNVNAALVLKGLYNNLIARAKDLKIDILKESNLRTIDFDKANRYEKVSICEEISKVIQQHDQSAVNELNMFESIKKPNPKLAHQTIKDKISGKVYEYDEKGRIKKVKNERDNADLISSYNVGIMYLKLQTDNGVSEVAFDKDGKLTNVYSEKVITEDGQKLEISRDDNGRIIIIDNKTTGEWITSFSYDGMYCQSSKDYFAGNGRQCCYDKNLNLLYYYDSEASQSELGSCNNVKKTLRNKDGLLIGTSEQIYQKGKQPDHNLCIETFKDAEGNTIAIHETVCDDEGRRCSSRYKDADGNEITDKQFYGLVNVRLF